jgi:uncharacterized phage-associated protein
MINIFDLLKKKSVVSIFDVAKYILAECGEMFVSKLQKLCYYCQAWSLAWDDVPLFEEEFHAWANGPGCDELFTETKGHLSIAASNMSGNMANLKTWQKETIDIVLDYYIGHDELWLGSLARSEEPWKIARGNLKPWETCNNIITKKSMASYYSNL